MTREEAIKAIQDFIGWFKKRSKIYQALEMAIKALSQEPCDDAISRKWLLDNKRTVYITDRFDGRTSAYISKKTVEDAPSVTQKSDEQLYKNGFADGYEQGHKDAEQKSGKWIYSDLLRVKHGTMNIDALIDKVWARMESEEISEHNMKMWEGIFKAESEDKE